MCLCLCLLCSLGIVPHPVSLLFSFLLFTTLGSTPAPALSSGVRFVTLTSFCLEAFQSLDVGVENAMVGEKRREGKGKVAV